jgi:outer membrane receptor for ferrienterochelin and colicins
LAAIVCLSAPLGAQSILSGRVLDAEGLPLPYATVRVMGTSRGGTTDVNGRFNQALAPGEKLVISFVGYRNDTLYQSSGNAEVAVQLQPEERHLTEVVVTGTMKESGLLSSPIPVEVFTPAFFRRNPTPSLFESLNMVNGVQPQINCNVCNTGDIHINGMEGPYTMVLLDGMPIVSSLSTVYGLFGIPNSLVKRIEVVKGPSSTLYGSEAVAGLINIITKDPGQAPRAFADASATSYGEFNADLSLRSEWGGISSLTGINYFGYGNPVDRNRDNFTDMTLQNRVSLFNKFDFERESKLPLSLAVRYVYEDRWGGEMQWTPEFRGSDSLYGESIYTNRLEIIGTAGISKSLSADVSLNTHHQDSYYGTVPYDARQTTAFAQMRWHRAAGKHGLLAGLPFRYIRYDDNTTGTLDGPDVTILPGLFIQDEVRWNTKASTLFGLRYDHDNRHGSIWSPRLALKYSPTPTQTLRLTGGTGFRVVNLFTEDHASLTGARSVEIRNELQPERSWNATLNYARTFTVSDGYLYLDGSLFYTYFTNKIIADYSTDPRKIIYDNLNGYSVSQGISLSADWERTSGLRLQAGITWMDVFQAEEDSQGGETRTPQLFAPGISGTFTAGYTFRRQGVTVDLTGRFSGPMALPVVPDDFRPDESPFYALLNAQLTKRIGAWEVYGGVKNLLNFMPEDPLLRPFDPFNKDVNDPVDNPNGYTFDTSYNYAPLQGIRGFLGVRYTL